MNKTKDVLTVTVDIELLATLKAKAKEENRTLSNYIETLLYKAIEE